MPASHLIDCPSCAAPATRPSGAIMHQCPAGHLTVGFLAPPRWKGTCPDTSHKRPLLPNPDAPGVYWCKGDAGTSDLDGHWCVEQTPPILEHLSPSSVSTAMQCARRFFYSYKLYRREPPRFATVAGSFAHEILEAVAQNDDGKRGPDALKPAAAARWPEFEKGRDYATLRIGNEDEQERRHFKATALSLAANAVDLHPLNGMEIVAVEGKFERVVGGVKIHGRKDLTVLIDGRRTVVDWKSGRYPGKTVAEHHQTLAERGWDAYVKDLGYLWKSYAEKLVQAHIYLAEEREAAGTHDVGSELWYVHPGDDGILIADPDETYKLVTEVRHLWKQLKIHEAEGMWPTTIGPLCGWCPFVTWQNPDGSWDGCAEGYRYVRDRMRSRWGFYKRGTNIPADQVVRIRELPDDARAQADAAAAELPPIGAAA